MVPPTGFSSPNKHGFRGGTDATVDGGTQTPTFDGFQTESSHIDKSAPKFIEFAEKRNKPKKFRFSYFCERTNKLAEIKAEI